jgi:hypothetical protein
MVSLQGGGGHCVQCGRVLRYAGWRLTAGPDLSCGVCAGPVLDAMRDEPLPEGEIPGQLELMSEPDPEREPQWQIQARICPDCYDDHDAGRPCAT